jgi:2',3'-cyclic-nucleotide 2'-phosphodiesterase (5'-nucleotidase family)
VFHGSFGTGQLPAGPLTVADCWRLIPYENRLVVAELDSRELAQIVAEDAEQSRSDRRLWPFDVRIDPRGRLESMRIRGAPVDPDGRFRVAFNAYDAQGAGRRLPRLAQLLARPQAGRRCTALDSRTALIDFLLEQREIG